MAADFISGLDLCQSFYQDAVEPILREQFPNLAYSAALIGSGSEVLGFDTEMSSDHHWGPRVMLFVRPADVATYESAVKQALSEKLPRRFRGYPTSYTDSNLTDNGVQLLDYSEEGLINHRVSITSIRDFLKSYIDFDINDELKAFDWLTFPDQKLLSLTSGRVFHDQVGLEEVRKKFSYYQHDVWLYLLASAWARLEQEEHLMGRAGYVGDEIGSALIASRLVRDLMRLCFLMEKRYAPYPKWFGTAFGKLTAAKTLQPILPKALAATSWKERETNLSQAYEHVAKMHNELGITEPMPTKVSQFHDRPFFVISMGAFSKAITAKITDPAILELVKKPLIGSVDQFTDSTDIQSDPVWRRGLYRLYAD